MMVRVWVGLTVLGCTSGGGEDIQSSDDAVRRHHRGAGVARDAGSDAAHVNDAGADAASDTGTSPQSVQLGIPPREQWMNGDGYCGETSIQSIGLYYGVWISQQLLRNAAGGELLLGVNETRALDAFHFTYVTWNNAAAQPQFQSFALWLKSNLAKGIPCIFAAYVTDGNDDPDYDHIMPATGIQFSSLAAYDPKDVLTLNDNFGDQLARPMSTLSATRASCAHASTEGGCVPQNVDFGTAVTGILDAQHVTLPVRASVSSKSEPNVSQGAKPVQMSATVAVSGLTAGAAYALLRYDDATKVPTNASAAGFLSSAYTFRVDFVATGPTWSHTDANTFSSSGATYYRCVPR
jgi:hypothetical protein